MRASTLKILLVAAALVALFPFVPWLLAEVFDGLNRDWLHALGNLDVTVPVGMGLGAISLAAYGLGLQRELSTELEGYLANVTGVVGAPQPVGAVAGAPGGTRAAATATVPAQVIGSAPAAAAAQEESAPQEGGGRKRGMGKSTKDKAKRDLSTKFKYRAQSEINRKISDFQRRF